MHILVLAGDAPDVGPRATLLGLTQVLRSLEPQPEILSTLGDDEADEGHAHTPGCHALYRAARRSDCVLLTSDAARPARATLALLPLLLARRGVRVEGVALASEAAPSSAARLLQRHLLHRLGTLLTAADPSSLRSIEGLLGRPIALLPDPALLVPPISSEAARHILQEAGAPLGGTALIGVSPRPVALRGQTPAAAMERFAGALARALQQDLALHDGFVVCLPAREGDAPLCAALLAALPPGRGCLAPTLHPAAFKGVASELTLLISCHRRAALLCASVGRPAIGLGQSAALAGALQMVGSPHAYLDAGLFAAGGLVDQLVELIAAAREARRASLVRIEELRAQARAGIRRLTEAYDNQ